MKTKQTLRRLFRIVAVGLGCTLMILSLAMPVAANGGVPTVDGLFYGDGDEVNYKVLGAADSGRGTLYFNRTGNTLYLAVVVSHTVNDNVFGDTGNANDKLYLQSAGWSGVGNKHQAFHLIQSDNVQLSLQCGADSWTWKQDYVYAGNNGWLSDPGGPDGTGSTSMPWLISTASSLQWNLNNSTWDVTLGGTRSGSSSWKSPDDGDNSVTDEGYPTWDDIHKWEWAMVYEMSIDVTKCGANAITVSVPSAHNSPSKSGGEDVPICPDGCPLTGSIGDYVWHDVNLNGVQDSGETGIADVTVNLYNSDGTYISTTQTDSSGYYIFNNLEPGDYYVEFVPPPDYDFSRQDQGSDDTVDSDADPATGKTGTISLSAGETALTWDAGLHLCDIGDRVWHDADDDGAQTGDDDQEGLNGVDVYLYNFNPSSCGMSGYLYKTTTISGTSQMPDGFPDGIYGFDMSLLASGQYWVCVDENTLPDPGEYMQWARTTANPQQVNYTGGDNFSIDFGYIAEGVPTAVTLSSFAARSSAGGWASPLWLGLTGLTVLAAGFWAKRRSR